MISLDNSGILKFVVVISNFALRQFFAHLKMIWGLKIWNFKKNIFLVRIFCIATFLSISLCFKQDKMQFHFDYRCGHIQVNKLCQSNITSSGKRVYSTKLWNLSGASWQKPYFCEAQQMRIHDFCEAWQLHIINYELYYLIVVVLLKYCKWRQDSAIINCHETVKSH